MAPLSPPYRDVSVGRLLTLLADALPGREALVYSHAGERWTFRALDDEARLIARGLIANGVVPGDRVAVWATSVPEWIVLQFALAKIGAILVTVNTALRAHEVDYLLRQCEAGTLFTIQGFRDVNYVDVLREIGAVGQARRLPAVGQAASLPSPAQQHAAATNTPGNRQAASLPHLGRVFFIGED